MPKRRPEGPRPYVEAFPGLDVLVVERMAKAGRLLCEWVDEDGRIAGHVRIREFSETRFVFDQQFRGPTMLPESGQRAVEIVRTHRVKEHGRPNILCQGCGRLVQRIHLVLGGWRCRICHGMGYHSQRASKIARDMLLNDYLIRRLSRGIGSFERRRDYTALRKKLGVVAKALVNSSGYQIPAAVRPILFAEWISEARGPVILWADADVPPAGVLPEPIAPEQVKARNPLLVAPWFADREDHSFGPATRFEFPLTRFS